MDNVRVVSLACLRRRLAELLAAEPMLRLRFDRALAGRDARALDDAFRCLRLYPKATRRAVEDAIFTWLFGERGEALEPARTKTRNGQEQERRRAPGTGRALPG